MDRKELEEIIRKAFKEGELWGSAYEGWFSPTDEQTEEHIQKAIDSILG